MFIEFQTIKFNNYKAIKSSSLTLSKRGVVLLQGTNNDKTGSNGAGKSTIASGLLWCLYDRTLAGKETEKEIIPKKQIISTKDFKRTHGCFVQLEFKRGDILYRVTRYRKHPVHKNTVTIEKMNSKTGAYDNNKTKCTDKETNAYIETVVGADYHAFVHSNVFSFSHIVPFLTQSDADKKSLILPKYFVETFKKASAKCADEIKATKIKLEDIASSSISLSIKESEKHDVEAVLLSDIESHNEELKQTEALISQEKLNSIEILKNIEKYTLEIGRCDNELSDLCAKKIVYEQGHARVSQGSVDIFLLTNDYTKVERDINAKKLELEELKVSNNGDSVGKLAKLTKAIEEKSTRLLSLEDKRKALEKELEIRKNTLREVLDTKNTLNKKYEDLQAKLRVLDNSLSSIISEKSTLIKQKEDIRTKYYSDECKQCPSSKMKGFFEASDKNVLALDKVLNKKQEEADRLKEELKNIYLFIEEVLTFENDANKAIIEIEQGELINIKHNIFLIDQALLIMKELMTDTQQEVDNAGTVAKRIIKTTEVITIMSGSLGNIGDVINQKKAEEFDAQVETFSILIAKNTEKHDRIKNHREATLVSLSSEKLRECEIATRIKGLTEIINKPSNLKDRLRTVSTDIIAIQKERDSCAIDQDKLSTILELLSFWKIGFSPVGIEGFMLDSLIDSMNSLISKYLSHLSNNTIALTLEPASTLKTGDVRNKIADKVENEFGGETYRSNSNGEKRTMDIALLFSLKYIYEEITGTKYNILFCDEAFDTLDSPTCSLVVELINSLENIDSVFVISHIDNLALEFENKIDIIKSNGVVTIEEND